MRNSDNRHMNSPKNEKNFLDRIGNRKQKKELDPVCVADIMLFEKRSTKDSCRRTNAQSTKKHRRSDRPFSMVADRVEEKQERNRRDIENKANCESWTYPSGWRLKREMPKKNKDKSDSQLAERIEYTGNTDKKRKDKGSIWAGRLTVHEEEYVKHQKKDNSKTGWSLLAGRLTDVNSKEKVGRSWWSGRKRGVESKSVNKNHFK